MEKISNSVYELRLELEAINEKINEFWEFYEYLPSGGSITKRYFRDLFQEFSDGNFLNAKTCLSKIVERLINESEYPIYQNVKNMFLTAIDDLKDAETLCDKALKLTEEVSYQVMNEKEIIKAKKKDVDLKFAELQEKKVPYLNLSLAIVLITMSIIFVFLPNFFVYATLMYHICGFMFFMGLVLIKQEVELRIKFGFVTQSEKLTAKRGFICLVQAVVYMIPLLVLSIFFYELLLIRILLFVQIWFCSVLLLNGILILAVHTHQNKKAEKFSIWGFILGAISIISFVIQMLQLFKVL